MLSHMWDSTAGTDPHTQRHRKFLSATASPVCYMMHTQHMPYRLQGSPASRARRSWHVQPHIKKHMSMRRQKRAMAVVISLMCMLALFRAHAEVLHDSKQLPQPHNIADAHMRKLLAAARYRGLKFDIQTSGSFLYPQSTLEGKDRGAWGEQECGL